MVSEGVRSRLGGEKMQRTDRLENEIFITKVRWLTILGAPVVLWFYKYQFTFLLVLVSILFALFNIYLQFYFLKKNDPAKYQFAFSVADNLYLAIIYLYTVPTHEGLPQLFYFLIFVLGIRHGMAKYHWIVLITGFIYAWLTISGSYYLGVIINPLAILNQLLFFAAFGVMSSYLFKKDYQQQMEKEDLITELQAAYQQLCVYNAQVEELANTDPLTGLYNYRYFTERLNKELEISKRFNRLLSLIIIDIDHFKDFNDTYGHPAGDQALKEAARVFRQNIRDKDVLCRYGGEEFLILLPSTGIEEAFKCAERIREAIQHQSVKINETVTENITISGGVACYPMDAGNGDQLLRIADEVLYSAKHKGRNKIHRRF